MTIAATAFDNVHGSSANTLNTSSKLWVTDRLYIVTVYNFQSGPTIPTISGLTQQGSSQLGPLSADYISIFSFKGDGNTNAKTIDFGGSSQLFIEAIVDEVTGTVITGTNASDAFLQPTGDNGSSATASVSLGAFGDSNNATWFASANSGGQPNTKKSGYTDLSTSNGTLYLSSEYKASNDTAPNMTLASSANWISYGIELVAAGSGPTDVTITPTGFGLTASQGSMAIQADTTLFDMPGYGMTIGLGAPSININGAITILASGFGLGISLGTPLANIVNNVRRNGRGFLGVGVGY